MFLQRKFKNEYGCRIKKCKICGVELIGDNISLSFLKKRNYICKDCDKKERQEKYPQIKQKANDANKKHYWKNRESLLINKKEYYQNTIEERRTYGNNYYLKNSEKIKDKQRKSFDKEKEKIRHYNYYHTPRGREVILKLQNERERNLGFNPLNTWFENSEAHHININDVIYVPYEINHCVYHNVYTGKNMFIINSMAYFFIFQQNINELSKMFGENQ